MFEFYKNNFINLLFVVSIRVSIKEGITYVHVKTLDHKCHTRQFPSLEAAEFSVNGMINQMREMLK